MQQALGLVVVAILIAPPVERALAQKQPAWLSITNQYYVRSAACWKKYDKAKIRLFSAAVHCADDGLIDALRAADYPSIDLAEWMVSEHASVAQQVDSKQITAVEGKARLAKVEADLLAEIQARNAAAAQQIANERAAQQADMQAQANAQAQAEADAERRAAMLRFSSGMLAPTRTGSFGESLGNGFNAYTGQPPSYAPPQVMWMAPTQTTCQRFGQQVVCNTQ